MLAAIVQRGPPDAAADQALATRGATDAFGQAAARAHQPRRPWRLGENDPGSAEVARRELARRWLFDDDDGTDGLSGDDALSPSPLEKKIGALARAAVKVAFVLSARDVTLSGDPIQAALQKALDGDAAADVVPRSDERGAVELLVELAAATGGPGDEADHQDADEVDAPWLDSDDDDQGSEVLARRAETGERRRRRREPATRAPSRRGARARRPEAVGRGVAACSKGRGRASNITGVE